METEQTSRDLSESRFVASNFWLLAITIIAALPALQTLATWDFDGRLGPQAFAIRHYSIPAVIGELLVFWLAVRAGLSIKAVLVELPKLVLALLAIWAAFALIALFADSHGLLNAGFILMRYTLHGCLLMSLVFLISQAPKFDKIFWLEAIGIGALGYAALIALFCVLVPDPDNFPWILRIPSATNIRQIANNIGIMAIAPFALLLAKEAGRKWLYWIAAVLVMAFTTWTGSRATLIGLFLGIGTAVILTIGFTTLRRVIVALIAVLAGLLVSIALPMPDTVFGLFRMISVSQDAAGNASSGRVETWNYTIQEITKSPWIGYGSGRYTEYMSRLYPIDLNHPHNFVLQYVYDWGLIGGAAATSLLALLGVAILRARAQSLMVRFTAIAAYVSTCTAALIDSPLFHPLPMIGAIALIAPVFNRQSTV